MTRLTYDIKAEPVGADWGDGMGWELYGYVWHYKADLDTKFRIGSMRLYKNPQDAIAAGRETLKQQIENTLKHLPG